jgi:methyl-accepting chemotaxis protein
MGNKTAKPIIIDTPIQPVLQCIPESPSQINNEKFSIVPDSIILENISISINDLVDLLKHYMQNYDSYITKEEFYNILDNYITYKDTSTFVKKGELLLKGNMTLKEDFLKVEDFKRFKEKLKVEISNKLVNKINKKIGESVKDIQSSQIELLNKIKEEYVSKEELKENLDELCNEFSKEIENVKCEVGESIQVINKVIEELNNNVIEIREGKRSYIEDNYDSLVNIVNNLNEEINECNIKIKERDEKIKESENRVDYLENKIIASEGRIGELENKVNYMSSNMEKIKELLNNILSKK